MADVRLTSSPWGFRHTPLERQCEWLKAHGIRYICGQCVKGMAGMFDPDISDDEIAQALKLVKRYGLRYASFNGEGDFMVKEGVEKEIEACCRRAETAAKFAAEILIVFAGWQDRRDDAVFDQVSSALKQIAGCAGRHHLTVALENHGGLTTTAEQINRILDAVDEPNIGVNYDPANFLMYGEDPLKALKELRHPVVFTHFKSVKHVGGKKVYCRLREGDIDYLPILKVLKRTYKGYYAIEYEEPSDVLAGSEDDLNSLKALLAEVR